MGRLEPGKQSGLGPKLIVDVPLDLNTIVPLPTDRWARPTAVDSTWIVLDRHNHAALVTPMGRLSITELGELTVDLEVARLEQLQGGG